MKRTVARRSVAFLSVLVIAMMLASLSFIALEADHECHHENCRICAMIIQCDNAFRNFGNSVLQFVIAAMAVSICLQFLFLCILGDAEALTPISAKVRLND